MSLRPLFWIDCASHGCCHRDRRGGVGSSISGPQHLRLGLQETGNGQGCHGMEEGREGSGHPRSGTVLTCQDFAHIPTSLQLCTTRERNLPWRCSVTCQSPAACSLGFSCHGSLIRVPSRGLRETHGRLSHSAYPKLPISSTCTCTFFSHSNICELRTRLKICGATVRFSSSVVFLMMRFIMHDILNLMKSQFILHLLPPPHNFS